MVADYRVRTQIRYSLENSYFINKSQPFAPHIAFQVAFCYQIGFGAKSDVNKCRIWLARSDKQPEDLKLEKVAVQPARWKSQRMRNLYRQNKINIVHEYRTTGLNKLKEAREEYEREVSDMVREFGELHFIPLALYTIIGDLLDELGEIRESKALRLRIRDQIAIYGINHPYYVVSVLRVFKSHYRLGEWREAQTLQEELLQDSESTHGVQSSVTESIRNSLALTYINQGRWKEAEVLDARAIQIARRNC
jgi:tetratricopeptide (TPR) repeat protein